MAEAPLGTDPVPVFKSPGNNPGMSPRKREGTQMKIKRIGQLAIGIWVLITLGMLTAQLACAEEREHEKRCTLATLDGRYLFVVNGTYFPPAAGVTAQSLFDRTGSRIFFGDGTGTTIARESVNGVVRPADLHSNLSYTINADCTGTLKILSVGQTAKSLSPQVVMS
jgi:hypothetical protein